MLEVWIAFIAGRFKTSFGRRYPDSKLRGWEDPNTCGVHCRYNFGNGLDLAAPSSRYKCRLEDYCSSVRCHLRKLDRTGSRHIVNRHGRKHTHGHDCIGRWINRSHSATAPDPWHGLVAQHIAYSNRPCPSNHRLMNRIDFQPGAAGGRPVDGLHPALRGRAFRGGSGSEPRIRPTPKRRALRRRRRRRALRRRAASASRRPNSAAWRAHGSGTLTVQRCAAFGFDGRHAAYVRNAQQP